MKTLNLLLIASLLVLLSACGGEGRSISPPPQNLEPELRAFHFIDSFGVSTEDEFEPLLIVDPYVDDGLFEIFWNVRSAADYRVEYRVNDAPSLSGSVLVYTERCGAGRNCDQSGLRLCQYYPDFFMACGFDEFETDIEHLIFTVPQTLYSILQVCRIDGSYCEYEYHPVRME